MLPSAPDPQDDWVDPLVDAVFRPVHQVVGKPVGVRHEKVAPVVGDVSAQASTLVQHHHLAKQRFQAIRGRAAGQAPAAAKSAQNQLHCLEAVRRVVFKLCQLVYHQYVKPHVLKPAQVNVDRGLVGPPLGLLCLQQPVQAFGVDDVDVSLLLEELVLVWAVQHHVA